MRSKNLLTDLQRYLRAEQDLSLPKSPGDREALMREVESDRTRLLREVQQQVQTSSPAERSGLFSRILVAVDSSPQARVAVDLAAKLAGGCRAEVGLVHVMDEMVGTFEGFAPPVSLEGMRCLHREKGNLLLATAAERFLPAHTGLDESDVPSIHSFLRQGAVVMQIIDVADSFNADLIVIGTHARRGISHFLMGSTAEGVIRRARCPVLSVSGCHE